MIPPNHANEVRVAAVQAGHRCGWSFTPLRGKVPYLRAWQNRACETRDQAASWARKGNIGLRTGSTSGVVVLDVDRDEIPPLLAGLVTPTVRTGSGRYHLYCAMPEHHIGCPALTLPCGDRIGEIKGTGGQVVFVGSIHPDTHGMYTWIAGRSPADVPLTKVPRWALEGRPPALEHRSRPAVVRYVRSGSLYDVARAYAARVPGAAVSNRHNAAVALGSHLAGFETPDGARLQAAEVAALLTEWNHRNTHPLPERELDGIVKWLTSGGSGRSGPRHLVRETHCQRERLQAIRQRRLHRIRRLREQARGGAP